jgi:hypothetical protein
MHQSQEVLGTILRWCSHRKSYSTSPVQNTTCRFNLVCICRPLQLRVLHELDTPTNAKEPEPPTRSVPQMPLPATGRRAQSQITPSCRADPKLSPWATCIATAFLGSGGMERNSGTAIPARRASTILGAVLVMAFHSAIAFPSVGPWSQGSVVVYVEGDVHSSNTTRIV